LVRTPTREKKRTPAKAMRGNTSKGKKKALLRNTNKGRKGKTNVLQEHQQARAKLKR
jgi:hypothetical protein